MVLYTTQSPEVYRIIQKDGIYFCDIRKSQVFDLFERSYNWLEGKVGEKVRRPAAAKGLIWAYHVLPEWFSYRYSGEIGKESVFMRLDVPDEIAHLGAISPDVLHGRCPHVARDER